MAGWSLNTVAVQSIAIMMTKKRKKPVKTRFSKFTLLHEPCTRRMLTVERAKALRKGLTIAGPEQRAEYERLLRLAEKGESGE